MRIPHIVLSICAVAVLTTAFAAGASAARSGDALQTALGYVKGQHKALGLKASDLGDMVVSDKYVSRHTGATHVYLVQRHKGIEVFNAILNVTVAADGSVASVGNRFVPNLNAAVNSAVPGRSAAQAVTNAGRHVGLTVKGLAVKESKGGAAREVLFNEGGVAAEPIGAKLVYEPLDSGKVRLAWQVELNERDGSNWWNMRVDAATGAVIGQADYVDQEGSYNVFALPKENPDDGPRTLVVDPAVSPASPFDWHDTNGLPGGEFTITRGNNAWAYTDRDANNKPDQNGSPEGGAGLLFDFALNLAQPPINYRDAAVTNLFYWNNIVHDVLYNYGFDEAAGNFQANNYGKGGKGTDAVDAEAQDGSGLNNANFGTPPDGKNPRMQMFEWTYPFPNEITVNAPPAIAGQTIPASAAQFGPQLTDVGPITGNVTIVNDGTAPTGDGCQSFTVPAGNIALVDRGTCNFTVKAANADGAGASALIVVNNSLGSPVLMAGAVAVDIPSVMIRKVDGDTLKANATGLNVTLDVTDPATLAANPNRDSDLDSTVIAHEYGHGVSNRLTGGPAHVACLNNAEQMGEGWSDFIALFLTANALDTATTARGVGNYLGWEGPTGFGIRPTPYSTDITVDPVTYGALATGTLTVPHGVGYAWASMLWEVYWNLVAKHSFNPNVYASWETGGNNLAMQLVIDGMKLQPCSPGFVDGRDAILAADELLTGGDNQCEIWAGFAKRGLGTGASQGSSKKLDDQVVSTAVPPECD